MESLKIASTVVASVIALAAFLPYVRDMFRGTTRPHSFTFLIWAITQGTATAILWQGGGGWGAVASTVFVGLTFSVFLLSLKFGTKNIKAFDVVVLVVDLIAILVWWQLESPLLAVVMVSAIDFIGYLPSFRKTYEEPGSETLSAWVLSTIALVFAVLALEAYNPLTLTYIVSIGVADIIMVVIIAWRRRAVKLSQQKA